MTQQRFKEMIFRVPQMDCGAEEQLVHMALGALDSIQRITCDLDHRTVTVVHTGDGDRIAQAINGLGMDASLVRSMELDHFDDSQDDADQRRALLLVLLINAGLFLGELLTGLLAHSMGLVADSLDMLADALVYGLSLYAVGKSLAHKRSVARTSGYFQLLLATLGIAEVIRRFVGMEETPQFLLMIVVSLVAMAGNIASLFILQRTRGQEVHIEASRIFTANDVLVNLGVMVAGILVFATGSKLPDLLIGIIVFCLVGYGALRILRLSRAQPPR